MVESYSFGRMVVSGKSYTSDLVIFPNRINSSWWRKTGHHLCLEDCQEIFVEDFDVFIIGTGYLGLMEVDNEVILHAKSLGIDLLIDKTRKAVEKFNKISPQQKTIAAFHLTC